MTRRTLCCTTLLVVLLAAIGFSAAAQEPLTFREVSELPGSPLTLPVPELLAPDDMAELQAFTNFTWKDVGSKKYAVFFTDTATDTEYSIQLKRGKFCNGVTCTFQPRDTTILSSLVDGMVVTWQVAGKLPEGKTRSETRTVTVNEVHKPTLSGFNNGDPLSLNGTITWTNANIVNASFRVVVIDTQTGAKVLNLYMNPMACNATCTIAPRHFTKLLTLGRSYKVFVKAKGFSGESAKSNVLTFVAQ